jgi:hypothetical protein
MSDEWQRAIPIYFHGSGVPGGFDASQMVQWLFDAKKGYGLVYIGSKYDECRCCKTSE